MGRVLFVCRLRRAVLFGGLARRLKSVGGVLVRLAGEFVSGKAALAVRGCGCGVGMGGQHVQLCGPIVKALGHRILLL